MLYGHLLGNLLPLLVRVLLRWQAFRHSKKAIVLYCISAALSQFLYRYLKKMGTPRRDSTGGLVSPGDDLNQPGMTEWIFDVLYISCELVNGHHIGTPSLIICRVCPSRLCYSRRMVLVDIHRGTIPLIPCSDLLDMSLSRFPYLWSTNYGAYLSHLCYLAGRLLLVKKNQGRKV
jgi:hypothetical protein